MMLGLWNWSARRWPTNVRTSSATFPRTRSLISIVLRMNRDNIRSPARSVANNEFHHQSDETNEVARRIMAALERAGIRALNPPTGFPMEADRWMTERMWVVSHKPVAVAAGLGRMGIHRNVIHPKFGNFISLGTVLLAAEVSAYTKELDYNPCLTCKLCVAACPVGAIGADGHFDFSACYTHNYREFMSGFADWVETIADSRNGRDYRRRVKDSESVSTWQSLGFGPNYKAAYCMAVCPAGDDVIGPFLASKKDFMDEVMRPLQAKREPRLCHSRFGRRGARGKTLSAQDRAARSQFASSAQHRGRLCKECRNSFQRHAAGQLDATYHFTFTGSEAADVTVVIRAGTIKVEPGLNGVVQYSHHR